MNPVTEWTFDYHNALTAGGVIALAIVLFTAASASEQLRFLRVSRFLKGLPVRALYILIVGLAIYGLIGHRLTA